MGKVCHCAACRETFVTCGNAYRMSNQVKAGSGLIKGCVVQSGTCFVGGGRRSMPCAGVGQPASVHQVVRASLAGSSSCPCSHNERTNTAGQCRAGQPASTAAGPEIPHVLWNLKVHYRAIAFVPCT